MPWRNQQVFDKVRARAAEKGLPPDLVEALWRQMVGWFIQHEEEKLRAQARGQAARLMRACAAHARYRPAHDTRPARRPRRRAS